MLLPFTGAPSGSKGIKTMRSTLAHAALAALLLLLPGPGCVPAQTSLEGKSCSASGACASGYACDSSTNLCVPEGSLPDAGDPDAGQPDASNPDGGDGGNVDGGNTDGGGGDGGGDGGGCVPEICNLIDDNCDGQTDEGFTDWDADGYCEAIDCDDLNPLANPNQGEVCDGADNNCDGATDEFDLALGSACDTDPADGILGECVHGATACIAGFLKCEPSAAASTDLCGHDATCDGNTDFPPPPGDLIAATLQIDMGGLGENTARTPTQYPLGLGDGIVQLVVTITPDTRYVTLADAGANISWHFITPGHGPRTGPVLEVGAVGSGASLELPEGLHKVRMIYVDPCGTGDQTQEFVLGVGTPSGSSKPGGDSDFKAVCADPAGTRVWAASTGNAYSLQPSLIQISSAGATNLLGCVVGAAEAGFFGRKNNGDKVYRYDDPTDLPTRLDPTVDNNDGIVLLGIAAGDGRRPWIVSEAKLKFYESGTPGNFTEDSSVVRPPDGGNVSCVIRESDTALWVCSANGVNRLDLAAFDPGNPSTGTWGFDPSLTIFAEAGESGGTRADALTFRDGILWGLTRDLNNRVVRFDAATYRACAASGCALADHVVSIDVSGNPASPTNRGDDLTVWSDGDLIIGSGNGLLRYQYCGPSDNCPSMAMELHLGDINDIDPMEGSIPWTVYAAAGGGGGEIFRYRGE